MRPTPQEYFLTIAQAAATRSTCPRASVGALIIVGGESRSTGYNGAPRGAVHCEDVGCIMIAGQCRRVVHAEANALERCPVLVAGGILVATHRPCLECCKLIVNARIGEVWWNVPYLDVNCEAFGLITQDEYLESLGVRSIQI